MQFIDLSQQYKRIQERIDDRIRQVLDHGQYIMGPEVEELEQKLADFVGTRYCVGVASGTDALLLALMTLNITKNDEVITSAFSFIATAEVIHLLGAKPVYVDIDPDTYNLDPAQLEAAITERTKAIVPVNLYGQCADYDEINEIADRHRLPVVEDAAQSFGATYKKQKSCSLTTIGCTSFFPSKPLGCYGDGGAVFTNEQEFADKLRMLRVHGQDRRYHHAVVGINGRLDTIQAAILLAKLETFEDEIKLRAQVAQRYSNQLADENIVLPLIKDYNESVIAQYTIQVEARDDFQAKLKNYGIPTAVHYPIPLYKQPALYQEGIVLAHTEYAAEHVVSLPMHPYLEEHEQKAIIETVKTTSI
jgi:UDP-2-acetamido-2-deoxy-ribo-hexuluronate aminotransferase